MERRLICRRRFLFYLLSFTWGLPLTLFGLLVAGILLLLGHRPKRFGPCLCFELGEGWGGSELGLVFLKCRDGDIRLSSHEYGHALQNCLYGPLMPLLVCIPSAVRYWYRRAVLRRGFKPKKPYSAVWFEKQADRWGDRFHMN